MKEEDDSALARRCLNGDRSAFEQLVMRYQKPVFNVALRLLRDPEEARDIAQNTFLKVFTHIADYDPSYRFYSWMYRIAVNESMNALQKRKSVVEISGDEVDESPGPEARVSGQQTTRAIEDALMMIKPELRAVVVLRHVMHMSYEDMGHVLQLPEKTVKSRLYSARQLLRELLLERETV